MDYERMRLWYDKVASAEFKKRRRFRILLDILYFSCLLSIFAGSFYLFCVAVSKIFGGQ